MVSCATYGIKFQNTFVLQRNVIKVPISRRLSILNFLWHGLVTAGKNESSQDFVLGHIITESNKQMKGKEPFLHICDKVKSKREFNQGNQTITQTNLNGGKKPFEALALEKKNRRFELTDKTGFYVSSRYTITILNAFISKTAHQVK